MKKQGTKKVVLAYSGGLDTSAIIPWLKENYGGCEVYALVANVGQDPKELVDVEKKAKASGAVACKIVDLREEFVKEYVYPVLKTGALYEGTYYLGTSMARPIIAKAQVEYALAIGADTLCHGATGKGNDQVRFETTYTALAPQLNVIAPWREWNLRSREALIDYLKERKIPTTATIEKIYSRDENAWHISTEGGVLESTWNQANKDCWAWTVAPEDAPNKSELVTIGIEKGEVVAVNGKKLSPYHCVATLNKIGAKHGVGRVDIIENRLVGIKSRGCYETPGGTIMMTALRGLEQLILDRDSYKWREQLGLEMSYVVYDGRWFAPYRRSLQAAAEVLAEDMTGEVVVKLYKGNATAVQKKSTNSLYSEEFATFGEDEVYDHSHAGGFIRLFSLSSRIRALHEEKKKQLSNTTKNVTQKADAKAKTQEEITMAPKANPAAKKAVKTDAKAKTKDTVKAAPKATAKAKPASKAAVKKDAKAKTSATVKTAPKTAVKNTVKATTKAKPAAKVTPKTDAKAKTSTTVKAAPKTTAKTTAKTATKAKPAVKVAPKTDAKAKAATTVKAAPKTAAKATTKVKPAAKATPKTDAKAKTSTTVKAAPKAAAKIVSKSTTKAKPVAKTTTKTDAKAKTSATVKAAPKAKAAVKSKPAVKTAPKAASKTDVKAKELVKSATKTAAKTKKK